MGQSKGLINCIKTFLEINIYSINLISMRICGHTSLREVSKDADLARSGLCCFLSG
jgi:hypothetical protein